MVPIDSIHSYITIYQELIWVVRLSWSKNGTDPPKTQMETDDQPSDGVLSPLETVGDGSHGVVPGQFPFAVGSTSLFNIVVQHRCSTWLFNMVVELGVIQFPNLKLFNVSPGPKGCEVFESVGENYQKLPTKAPSSTAVEGPICQVDVSSGWFKPRIIGCGDLT